MKYKLLILFLLFLTSLSSQAQSVNAFPKIRNDSMFAVWDLGGGDSLYKWLDPDRPVPFAISWYITDTTRKNIYDSIRELIGKNTTAMGRDIMNKPSPSENSALVGTPGGNSIWRNSAQFLGDIGAQPLITQGNTLQYFRGDLSLATFPTTTAAFINSTNKNFVTDVQATVIGNTSGTNSGDNATNTQYSGLAASKQDALGFTPVPNTRTVNGQALSGNITILANVDNTSDANKPVSTAQQTALNLKANLASPSFTGTVSGVTATMVGLGNVNNTSDANKPVSTAQQTAIDGKQGTLVSGTNIKTINGGSVLGSGDLVVAGAAAWGSITGTLSNQADLQTALDARLLKPTTAGVGASPTASSTTTVTHNLGRVPSIIRIYGYGSFTSNAAATATTSSMGIFSSSGNFCVYQRYGAAITTTQAGLSSNTFAILLATGGGNFISGVIQNVDGDSFDIVWTETGTATAQVYLWEAQ